jgi:hypothetical protein
MDKLTINQYKTSFDTISQYIENEQKEQVEVCNTQNISVDDHFREVTKMIQIGIKKLERRVTSEPKKIEKSTNKLPKIKS